MDSTAHWSLHIPLLISPLTEKGAANANPANIIETAVRLGSLITSVAVIYMSRSIERWKSAVQEAGWTCSINVMELGKWLDG